MRRRSLRRRDPTPPERSHAVKTKTVHPNLNGPNPKVRLPRPAVSEDPELHRRIARKAYELYEQRGRQHGHDREDWLEAEQLILSERAPFPLHATGRA